VAEAQIAPQGEAKFSLHNLVKRDPRAGLAEDVRRGLASQPKRFLPKYFYDQLGSQLFEAICLLPEYYLTRAENEILDLYADEIAASVDGRITLVEMGSGSASKTRLIIEAILRKQSELLFVPVDISASALDSSSRILLQSYPQLSIEAYAADYFAGLAELGKKQRTRTLALFLGLDVVRGVPPTLHAALATAMGAAAAVVVIVAFPAAGANGHALPAGLSVAAVALATLAAIIASQAVISGAYSMTKQAIQLGFLPRMRVSYTSAREAGQIYMPTVNALLLVGVIALVLAFASSSRLAGAYGIAVTGTMVVTAVLAVVVINRHWRWPLVWALALIAPFLAVDLVFLGANLMKVLDGGYVPVVIAGVIVVVMWTWAKGRALLTAKDRLAEMPLAELIAQLRRKPLPVNPGTAVYLTAHPDQAPVALLHSLKHFKSLHEQNVILTVRTAEMPRILDEDRVQMEVIDPAFRRVTLTFGYMEQPDVPQALGLCRKLGWTFDIMSTSFLISRRSLKLAAKSGMPVWQSRLFIFLARNAASATDYFRIPAGRVVEIGTQVNL